METIKPLYLDEKVKSMLPKKIEVYTDHGTFKFSISDVTREADILRISYNGSTYEETGEALADGEPDFVVFDLHFQTVENKLQIIVNISYGDTMVSEFKLLQPNIVKVGHYEGIGSKASPDTHFGFSDNTLKDLVKIFNSFDAGFQLTTNDFKFIDKYPDSYQHHEAVKLMPLSDRQKILLIDNSKPPKHRFIDNLKYYLSNRGIEFVKVTNINEAYSIEPRTIIGIIMSGSEYNIDNSPQKQELFSWAIQNFTCPTLAICYAAQSMMNHYGAKLYRGKLLHDNLKFDQFKEHKLLDGIDCQKFQFNFSFRDYITACPNGFEEVARIGKRVVFAANDAKKEYAIFFHPENMEFTQKFLDNFLDLIHPAQREQEKILNGKFESRILNFTNFRNLKSQRIR